MCSRQGHGWVASFLVGQSHSAQPVCPVRFMIVVPTRLVIVVFYFAVWTVVGTAGYVWVEGWSVGDSLYMTVITLTAVGYQEVHVGPYKYIR